MTLEPYLFFDGRCDEAIGFYRETLGAQVEMLMRFKDNPQPDPRTQTPGMAEKVMHAKLRVGDATLYASDGNCGGKANFAGFSLTLMVNSLDEAQRVFAALGDGGKVQMPMAKTFFSPGFGMVADRFGVSWQVIVSP
jgi:PhnB protein